MLASLITSKTRIKLLMKFFLNPNTRGYLRELASEFGESTNSIRVELNRLTDANLLTSEQNGRTIQYSANKSHTMFSEIQSLVQKYMGLDQIIDQLVAKLGEVKSAYIIGDYARGIDSGLVDIVLVGDINKRELDKVAERRGKDLGRTIRPLVVSKQQLRSLWDQLKMDQALLIWGDPISKIS